MSNEHRRNLRTRVLRMLLLLVAGVLCCMALIFNMLMRDYIETNANEQLRGVLDQLRHSQEIKLFETLLPPGILPGEPGAQRPPMTFGSRIQVQLPRGQTGRTEAIICTGDYQLVEQSVPGFFPPEENQGYVDAMALLGQLREQGYDLGSGKIQRIQKGEVEYYLVGMLLENGVEQFVIYYLDTTALSAFAQRVNTVFLLLLVLVVPLTVVISAYISGRISNPIQELSTFAQRIGRGDFRQLTQQYQDRELYDLARNMNLAAAQLEAYDHEQQTFFQNVSHELRTPLQVIKINAEGLQHGILEQRRACGEIGRETDRLTGMVEDLLFLSRMDSAATRLSFAICDLREILAAAAEQQHAMVEEAGLAFIYDFDENPVEIEGDEKHLQRACANLISNALRYAARQIILHCHNDSAGAWLSVEDDGPGVAQNDIERVFDRFYRGESGKHGIGLAIVKGIVEQHDATVCVDNVPGARFTIRFRNNERA